MGFYNPIIQYLGTSNEKIRNREVFNAMKIQIYVTRSLSTSQVIPVASGLLDPIRKGDLEAVRRLLATYQIQPNDRGEFGQSLRLVSSRSIVPHYLILI